MIGGLEHYQVIFKNVTVGYSSESLLRQIRRLLGAYIVSYTVV